MEIEISPELLKNMEKASKELNLNEEELIVRAIKLYLNNIRDQLELREEMDAWEEASEEDIITWEKENL